MKNVGFLLQGTITESFWMVEWSGLFRLFWVVWRSNLSDFEVFSQEG